MKSVLIVVLVILGIVFLGSVLLMSPKGGLSAGIMGGGAGGGNEYGSKKTIEGKLKYIATISGILFVIVCLILPYTVQG